MSLAPLPRRVFSVLLPLAVISTIYLYLYPVFHGCAFPIKDGLPRTALWNTLKQHTYTAQSNPFPAHLPPFRLLVLADPQLEGDSSLPDPEEALIPSLRRHWTTITTYDNETETQLGLIEAAVQDIVYEDVPRALKSLRKRVDLFGNDYYLAHIYRTLHWWTKPSHVTVLGDLMGSQWVTDDEFTSRGWRFWNRVFSDGKKIEFSALPQLNTPQPMDQTTWNNKIINLVGNHDIGYAGDVSDHRINRFEEVFGPVNWDLRFSHPPPETDNPSSSSQDTQQQDPTLHLVILNSLSLDGPPLDPNIQSATYTYVNDLISFRSRPVEDHTSFTLLLTHLPLHKPEGVCVDAPFFAYQEHDDDEGRFKQDGLREQNHLSEHVSTQGILQGIFGMSPDKTAPAEGKGRNGLILTGHDHEGCDVWHHIPSSTPPAEASETDEQPPTTWQSVPWPIANTTSSHTGVREITLRSMMGSYNGNAGLLSLWFDFDAGEWRYDVQMCTLGVQHIWWAVHIADIVTLLAGIVWGFTAALAPMQKQGVRVKEKGETKESTPNGSTETRPKK